MRRLLILAASVIAFTTIQSSAAPSAGVCIKAEIGLVGVEPGTCLQAGKTAPLLDTQVETKKGKPHSAEMSNGDQKKTITTCREYISSKSDGWITPDARFYQVCDAVMMLSGAVPATQSFLREGDTDLKDLARVTALALPGSPPIDPMAAPDTRSIDDMIKAKSFELEDAKSGYALAVSRGGLITTFREMARGDVDNDGIEDLLVERSEHMGGQGQDTVFFLLTRIEQNGMLEMNDSFGG
jgi:hypothetical protein